MLLELLATEPLTASDSVFNRHKKQAEIIPRPEIQTLKDELN